MAFKGLSTSLSKRLLRTWPIPSGAATSVFALVRVICTGSKKLARTATNAAAKVPSKYKKITVFILVFCPFWCWERALATREKTKIGAMAFSPPTKRSPSRPIPVRFGKSIPNVAPKIIPIRIRLMRLALVQALMIRFIAVSFKMYCL